MVYLPPTANRCIAHDRRGHGRSSQPWSGNNMDTYADDLSELIETLGLKGAVLIRLLRGRWRSGSLYRPPRHEAGGQGRADRRRSAADAENGGQSRRLADGGVRQDSPRIPCRPLAALQGSRQRSIFRGQPAWRQGLAGDDRLVLAPGDAGRPPEHLRLCIKAFSETDFTEDLKKFDVPTPLIVHGDDDQIRTDRRCGSPLIEVGQGTRRSESTRAHLTAWRKRTKTNSTPTCWSSLS